MIREKTGRFTARRIALVLFLALSSTALTSGREALAESVPSPTDRRGNEAGAAPTEVGAVVVNGTPLGSGTLEALESRYGVAIPQGRYWYDTTCGAWGVENGPALGVTLAGVDLGAPLRADASGGGNGSLTGVFFNGRELHPLDVTALAQLVPVYPGRYWIDAQGNAGFEGGPVLVNLWQLAARAGRGSGGSYQRSTAGGYIGGDGSTSYFFDPETGSSVMVGN